MKRIFLIAAMFALPSTVAMAAIDTDGLIAGYQAEGYTTIEVTRGLNQTKVEAIRGTEKVEVVYDNATGQPMKSEVEAAEADDDIRPGVTVRDRNRDFVRANSSDDDSMDDDGDDDNGKGRGRGRGRDGDIGDDDDGGDDNGSDDNGSDDNGGDDNGDDDDGGDDNGGDDNGGDDD
ncbi:MAG: PepSY domain-containing protein [Pseudorhodobacter sp.]|nr:MAG: PepSY domain-containing protein [Pseudorhodobacter sp.]